jgi:hypothetical protein
VKPKVETRSNIKIPLKAKTMKIEKRYLQFSIKTGAPKHWLFLKAGDQVLREFEIWPNNLTKVRIFRKVVTSGPFWMSAPGSVRNCPSRLNRPSPMPSLMFFRNPMSPYIPRPMFKNLMCRKPL